MRAVTRMNTLAALAMLVVSCANQEVAESVDAHETHEGKRFAAEVAAQSPFKPVRISWREAHELMKERNLAYRAAANDYYQATEETPVVKQLSGQLKQSMTISVGDVLKPQSLAKSFQDPVAQLPKQLKSLSSLKDISHEMEQTVWSKTGESVEAEFAMRKERVKLHALLRQGEVFDSEFKRLEAAQPSEIADVTPESGDPKFAKAVEKWQQQLENDRAIWLKEVRDFFNAEYYDVTFEKDASGLTLYRNLSQPQLSQWQRWCALSRSKSLVEALKEDHEDSKPTVPGTDKVKSKLASFLDKDEKAEVKVKLKTQEVRGQVRSLIRNWRELKRAQSGVATLDLSSDFVPSNAAELSKVQQHYQLRKKEIQHASVIWLMDEQCWGD